MAPPELRLLSLDVFTMGDFLAFEALALLTSSILLRTFGLLSFLL